MRTLRLLTVNLVFAVALSLAGASHALTLSAEPGDCFSSVPDDCIGGVYSLNVVADGSEWVATFEADLSPGLEVPATHLMQVEFKVASSYSSPSIDSSPAGTGDWAFADGPLNGTGCGGSNDSFLCLSSGTPLPLAGVTTATWKIRFSTDALLAEGDWHIGARFSALQRSGSWKNGWVLSASGAPIPEPTSGLVFGAGILVVGLAVRRAA